MAESISALGIYCYRLISAVSWRISISMTLLAGIFDRIEDNMELWYIRHLSNLSEAFFFLHVLTAYTKFTAIFAAVFYIPIVFMRRHSSNKRGPCKHKS